MADNSPLSWRVIEYGSLKPVRRKRGKPEHPAIPIYGGAYAVVAGKRFDIKAMSLHDGQIHFTAYRDGPSKAVTGYVTIFGSDGIGICQAAGEFNVPAAPKGAIIEYKISLRMNTTVKV